MDDDGDGRGLDGGEVGAGVGEGWEGGSERGWAEGEKSCHFPTPH